MALEMHPSLHGHVGEWLRTEIVEPSKITITDLAAHLRVSRQALSTLLNGNMQLTPEMAIRFEKAFGLKADTLMRMQSAYALAVARKSAADIDVSQLTVPA